jgi:transposase
MRHEVIVGVERRRSWPDEVKLSILSEIGGGGASMADVARRHDISRQQLYQWRRQMCAKGLSPCPDGTVFLALDEPEGTAAITPEPDAFRDIEICFPNGRILRCAERVADAEVARLIRLVEGA